jgi:hypothetical protein
VDVTRTPIVERVTSKPEVNFPIADLSLIYLCLVRRFCGSDS